MQPLLDRVGIVLHWIGLIISLCMYFYFIYSLFQHFGVEYTFEYDRPSLFTNAQVTGSFIFIFPPLIIAWTLRYILSGSIYLIPGEKEETRGVIAVLVFLPLLIFFPYYIWVTS
tara:strand:+ start:541 stop:882 length:342 start_codon:yes stop_codon:yes gene_type:complete